MPWYLYLAHFLAGVFFANAIPHLVNGVSGRPFPTPFASPPGRGLSSPVVNVLWATLNVVCGFLLMLYRGEVHILDSQDALTVGAGGMVMSLLLALTFGKRLSGK